MNNNLTTTRYTDVISTKQQESQKYERNYEYIDYSTSYNPISYHNYHNIQYYDNESYMQIPPPIVYEEKRQESDSIKPKRKQYKRKYVREEDSSENESSSESESESDIENENRRLYCVKVDNLNDKCDERLLSDVFGIVGNIESVEINNESSKRSATVKYSNKESAIKAIHKFNDKRLKDEKIKVYMYKDPNELIIENLSLATTTEKMANILSVCGETKSIIIEESNDNSERNRAIIIFEDEEGKKNAINLLQDSEIDRMKIRLVIDENDKDISSVNPSPSPLQSEAISIPLLPMQLEEKEKEKEKQKINALCNSIYAINTPLIIKNLTKKEIEFIFSKYKIKSINPLLNENEYEVYFQNDDLAKQAYCDLSDREYNHKIISIEIGKRTREKLHLNTVFIGCLTDAVKEEDLKEVFGRIGEIHSLKIFRQKNRDVPDYAYVNFKDEKCVDEAVKRLNGININGRFITVQYPKKKKTKAN